MNNKLFLGEALQQLAVPSQMNAMASMQRIWQYAELTLTSSSGGTEVSSRTPVTSEYVYDVISHLFQFEAT